MGPRPDRISESQRQMVVSPIEATSPRRNASRLISLMLNARGEAQLAGQLTGEGLCGDDDAGARD
jgi:hypothetical protein